MNNSIFGSSTTPRGETRKPKISFKKLTSNTRACPKTTSDTIFSRISVVRARMPDCHNKLIHPAGKFSPRRQRANRDTKLEGVHQLRGNFSGLQRRPRRRHIDTGREKGRTTGRHESLHTSLTSSEQGRISTSHLVQTSTWMEREKGRTTGRHESLHTSLTPSKQGRTSTSHLSLRRTPLSCELHFITGGTQYITPPTV